MNEVNPDLPTILVVDDDERLRERLEKSLRKRGHEVFAAADGESAIQVCADQAPEWALVDLKMPGMNGLQLVKALLDEEPELRIVVLTAFGSIATALEAVRRGAIDYLQKPADIEEILHAFGRKAGEERPEPPIEVPSLARAEWEHISRVLEESGGSIRKAAQMLGMHRRTLQRKLAKYPVRN